MEIEPVAYIRTDFPDKFGIPRQSGLVEELEGEIVFTGRYRNPDALRGIEDFSHLWLIWGFSENVRDEQALLVRPPRLGGNEKLGVFATRSPFRANNLGLSCVELAAVVKTADRGTVLRVRGADLMDGTPIYDVKPYIAYSDAHPEARCGFASEPDQGVLEVVCPSELRNLLGDKAQAVLDVLARDPRPAYHHDPDRRYEMNFAGFQIGFSVADGVVTVCGVSRVHETR